MSADGVAALLASSSKLSSVWAAPPQPAEATLLESTIGSPTPISARGLPRQGCQSDGSHNSLSAGSRHESRGSSGTTASCHAKSAGAAAGIAGAVFTVEESAGGAPTEAGRQASGGGASSSGLPLQGKSTASQSHHTSGSLSPTSYGSQSLHPLNVSEGDRSQNMLQKVHIEEIQRKLQNTLQAFRGEMVMLLHDVIAKQDTVMETLLQRSAGTGGTHEENSFDQPFLRREDSALGSQVARSCNRVLVPASPQHGQAGATAPASMAVSQGGCRSTQTLNLSNQPTLSLPALPRLVPAWPTTDISTVDESGISDSHDTIKAGRQRVIGMRLPSIPHKLSEDSLGDQESIASHRNSLRRLGATEASIETLVMAPEVEVTRTMGQETKRQHSRPRSHLSTSSSDSASRVLAVKIVGASGLRNADHLSKSDPYCICHICHLDGKEGTRTKTRVIYNSLSPTWNHEVIFEDFGTGDELHFAVVDRDVGSDDPLGSTIVPLELLMRPGGFDRELPLTGKGSIGSARLRIKAQLKMGEDARRFRAKVERKAKRMSSQVVDEKDEIGFGKLLKYDSSTFATRKAGRAIKHVTKSLDEWRECRTARALWDWSRHPLYEVAKSCFLLLDAALAFWETQRASQVLLQDFSRDSIPDDPVMSATVYVFLAFFTFDLTVRFISGDFPHPAWTVFNCLAMVSYTLEVVVYNTHWHQRSRSAFRFGVTVFSKIRIARLLQFVQVTRVGQALLSDILLMMRSIRGTVKTTACCLFMMLFFLLCSSFVFVEGVLQHVLKHSADVSDDLRNSFGTLTRSTFTLFMAISGGEDWGQIYETLSPLGWSYRCLFLGYMFYAVFAFMNVITAVVVENMMEASKSDRQILVTGELKAKGAFLKNMERVFEAVDADGTGDITLDELQEHLQDTNTCAYFAALGVDAHQVSQLFSLLDEDQSGLVSREEFLKGCLNLRGDAKGIDIAIMLRQIDCILDSMELISDALEPLLERESSSRRQVSGAGQLGLTLRRRMPSLGSSFKTVNRPQTVSTAPDTLSP